MHTRRAVLVLALLLPCAASLAGFGKPATKPSGKSKKAASKAGKGKPFDGKKAFEAQMRSWNRLDEYPREEIDVVDVYVRSSKGSKFWFVGKAAAKADACDDAAACSAVLQKRLVFEHSKLLQLELKTARELQLWCAPGNTEMRVAQKQQGLRPLDGSAVPHARDALTLAECGFMPEQYDKANGEREQGFYVRLPPDGQPVGKSDVKVVSPEELEEMRVSGKLTTG